MVSHEILRDTSIGSSEPLLVLCRKVEAKLTEEALRCEVVEAYSKLEGLMREQVRPVDSTEYERLDP